MLRRNYYKIHDSHLADGLFQNSIDKSKDQNPFCPGYLVSHSWHRVWDIQRFHEIDFKITYNHVICSFPHNLVKFVEKKKHRCDKTNSFVLSLKTGQILAVCLRFENCSKHAIFIEVDFDHHPSKTEALGAQGVLHRFQI